jgi:hypothetical protein
MKKSTSFFAVAVLCVLASAGILSCQKTDNLENGGTAPSLASQKVSVASAAAVAFVHPGILNTQESLDIAANEANTNNQARLAAYQYVLDYCNNVSPSNAYKANVGVKGGDVTQDEQNFKGDALLAYSLALRWSKTGTASYATTAREILCCADCAKRIMAEWVF